ncbi:hypothetical protein OHA44_21350 [Streptomyces sp. NBC_00144]|uniref:hypothetical protein n=1 Tax=Streptomyces sp. NBC_00144 TaxID=2975665 RepID=UPI00324C5312
MGPNEAGQLRKLAEDVRSLLDDPVAIASDQHAKPDERWTGPNAADVRGGLAVRSKRLSTFAAEIDKKAEKKRGSGDSPEKGR